MVDFKKRVYNTDKFRQAALYFKEHGCYTQAPRGTTDYVKYWEQETKRCLEGYVAEDGDPISGYHYFYLNYFPILRLVETTYTDKYGNQKTKFVRETEFADFYDYDYYFFNAVEQAEEIGKHMAVLKARGRGYSFKASSMLVRNYELIPNSQNFAVASEQSFLTNDGILTKAWAGMDFIDKHTAWAKQRLVDTKLKRTSGFKITDEFGKQIEDGYKSSIIGITTKNNPDRIRGIRGRLIVWEEAGKFKDILQAWQIARPSVEDTGGNAFGTMLAFGCVCKGTRVWTSSGDCVNIEDIHQEDGILGWDTYQAVQQHISNINPPAQKPCVRITTNTGRTLECSTDHPILWSYGGLTKRVPGKRADNEVMKQWKWHEACKCKVGEQVGIINSVPFFGEEVMWEPRVVGWLIGDGSYGYDKTPRLSNCDDEINSYIEQNFDTAPDCEPRMTKDGRIYKETRIKGICQNLRKLGIYGQTKKEKRLPINIHKYGPNSLSELIGGLFDTDGYITIDKNGRPRIVLTQCQEEILRQIEEVLLHFGVHCIIRFIKTKHREHVSGGKVIKDGPGCWRLEINDVTSIGNFANNITCVVKYKQAALDYMMLYSQEHLAKYHKYVIGIHAERIVSIEDIGMRDIYNLTADEQNNYICNGIVTHNTGGSTGSDFVGLKEMFYHPTGYNIDSYPNIWDDNASDQQCAFFCPAWSNVTAIDRSTNKRMCMDDDGNSLREKAVQFCIDKRKEVQDGASEQVTVDRYVAENPLTPQESILEIGGNIFPKKLLMQQLAKIRTNAKLQNMKHIVDLAWDGDGKVIATEKKTGDITQYPLPKEKKPHGSVVIWEYPITDPPYGLYIGGCDPLTYQRGITEQKR